MDKKKKILLYAVAGVGVAVSVYAAYQIFGKKKKLLLVVDPMIGAQINDIKSMQTKGPNPALSNRIIQLKS